MKECTAVWVGSEAKLTVGVQLRECVQTNSPSDGLIILCCKSFNQTKEMYSYFLVGFTRSLILIYNTFVSVTHSALCFRIFVEHTETKLQILKKDFRVTWKWWFYFVQCQQLMLKEHLIVFKVFRFTQIILTTNVTIYLGEENRTCKMIQWKQKQSKETGWINTSTTIQTTPP